MKQLLWIAISIVVVVLGCSNDLSAQTPDNRLLPQLETLCRGGIVDKFLLYKQFLKFSNVSEDLKQAVYPNWQRIMSDPPICPGNRGCQAGDDAAIAAMRLQFATFVKEGGERRIYVAKNSNISASQYFQSDKSAYPIACIGPGPSAPVPDKVVDKSFVRLRGNSDDLWVDRNRQEFKGTSTATASFTNDGSGVRTQTTKVQAAIGYALPFDTPSSYRTVIPYVAFNQSITDTEGKPRALALSNFVAGGFLFTNDIAGRHVITVKPQYVYGTTMRSELAMVQAIYAPWTDAAERAPFMPLNTAVPVFQTAEMPAPVWGQFLFDLRADLGHYVKRGDTPYAAQNLDFQRYGTRFGVAFFTAPPNLPSVTLKLSQIALYGASGYVRNLSFFDSSLSFGFDPNNYFSFTLGYTKGRDENTTAIVQNYKAGLSAHY